MSDFLSKEHDLSAEQRAHLHDAERAPAATSDQATATKRKGFTLEADLMPIIEPEVSIKCSNKATADRLLVEAIQAKLDELPQD